MLSFRAIRPGGQSPWSLRDALSLVLFALARAPSMTVAWNAPAVGIALAILVGVLIPAWGVWSVLRRETPSLGPADRITLVRTFLTGGVAALALVSLPGAEPVCAWATLMLAVPAIVLDGADGYVARRTGTASGDGARFDTEADALLALSLSLSAGVVVGWWVLLIGLMRYAFVGAARFRPSLRRPLPASALRRGIGVLQPIALCVVLLPVITPSVASAVAGLSLALLVFSFSRDIVRQERAG